jgi:hypothetical protein
MPFKFTGTLNKFVIDPGEGQLSAADQNELNEVARKLQPSDNSASHTPVSKGNKSGAGPMASWWRRGSASWDARAKGTPVDRFSELR